MKNRKKKIISIQLIIFLFASFLLYSTYKEKNEVNEEFVKIKVESNADSNSFTDVEYSGFDLNGNRYTLDAGKATFETESPETIVMKKVEANFYLKDDTILNVISDGGVYNNITLDMEFSGNVKATYLTNTLFSDKLNYFNSTSKLLASGKVHGESVEKGEFFADNVEYDLNKKTLDLTMFGSQQVKMKVKN